MMDAEEWRPVASAPGLYDVSSLGRVRRSESAPAAMGTRPGRIMSARPDSRSGYVRVTLHRSGKVVRAQAHRLVAAAFLPPSLPRSHVNHIDGNKANNEVSNLEWCTPQENVRHAWRTGLASAVTGEAHGCAKLSQGDVARVRDARARGVPLSSIAAVFNVTESHISNIARGQSWRSQKEDAHVV